MLMPKNTLAQQSLVYGSPQNYKENQITQFVSQYAVRHDADYVIADIDLNDDAISEYVVKPLNCSKNTMCPHYIVAFKKHKPILLLDLEAYKITPSGKTTFGILDLIIHNQRHNDFLSKNFGWNPHSYRYEQKEF